VNLITVNFKNIFTIGLISLLGSVIVRAVESKTGLDIDGDGEVAEFAPFFGAGSTSGRKGRKGSNKR